MKLFDIEGPLKSDNESMFPGLSYKERLMGFAFCFFMGNYYLRSNRLFHSILIIRFVNWFIGRKSNKICG